MKNNFVTSFARKAMFATIGVMATACQQHLPDLSAAYTQNSSIVVANFAAGVSRGFTKPNGVNTRGLYDGSTSFNQSFTGLYGSPGTSSASTGTGTGNYNYYGSDPYNGTIINAALENEVQDCAGFVEGVPAIPQNFQYMAGSLARCLDRILTYRNPLLTFAYRNMPQESQQQFAYLLNWRQPGTMSQFGGTPGSVMNTYATQGYVPATY